MDKFDDINYWLYQIDGDREAAVKLMTEFWTGSALGYDLSQQYKAWSLLSDFHSHTSLLEDELVRLQKEAAKPFWKKLFRK